MPYQTYNQSSEDMSAVASESVDLILAGPPYNIGTTYSTNPDTTPTADFQAMLSRIFTECGRVIKPGGHLVVECADTVFRAGEYTCLSAQVARMAVSAGLTLVERHVSYTHSENGLETPPDSHWTDSFVTTDGAHSNCHQIMVFQKGQAEFNALVGKVLYYEYPENEDGHPCPYSPALISFVLDRYYSEGDTVLDPFMGTGRLGQEVVRRGGTFIGFELEEAFYKAAEQRLSNVV